MPGNNLDGFDDSLRRIYNSTVISNLSMQPRATDLGVFNVQIDNALRRIRWCEDPAWTDFGSACIWTDAWVKMWGAVAAAHERRVFGTGELW